MGDDFEEGETVKFSILDEDEESGLNTLTPRHSCPNYDSLANNDIVREYNTSYLNDIADRLEDQNPGFQLTTSEVNYLLNGVPMKSMFVDQVHSVIFSPIKNILEEVTILIYPTIIAMVLVTILQE